MKSCLADAKVRNASGIGALIREYGTREAGWSVCELLSIAAARKVEAERRARSLGDRVHALEVQVKEANLRTEMWIDHYERLTGRGVAPVRQGDPYGNRYPTDYNARGTEPTGTGAGAFTDPYQASEAKRQRLLYERGSGSASASQVFPPEDIVEAPFRRDPYSTSLPSNPYDRYCQ